MNPLLLPSGRRLSRVPRFIRRLRPGLLRSILIASTIGQTREQAYWMQCW